MVVCVFALVGGAATGAATSQVSSDSFRLLFGSDWSGSYEIYAADPSRARPTAQLTFGRAPACAETACGYADWGPSPDGRFILYSDFSACDYGSSSRSALFVARADGSHVVVLARSTVPANCQGGIGASWAPDSRRVAYAADGRIGIAAVDGRDRRVVGRGDRVSWSPDGTAIAFSAVGVGGYGPLSVWTNGRTHVLTATATGFRWSPDGRWLAYGFTDRSSQDETAIVHPDGSGRRVLAGAVLQPSGWSPDGRFLTVWSGGGVVAVRVADGSVHPLGFASALAWQPRGHVLAVTDEHGTFVLDVATGASRLLTGEQAAAGAWSPDGGSFAYVWRSSPTYFGYSDLRVVTLAGVTRTLVRGGGPYGGYVGGLVWARVPSGARYRPAQPRVLAEVGDDGLTAPWPITRLATDGNRVAYISCGHVFVWTPSARSLVQAEPSSSMSPRCTTPGDYLSFSLYTLALSGDRIAYGYLEGNNGQHWGLYAGRIGDGTSLVSLAGVSSVGGCAVGPGGLGDLGGADGLLVFSTWRDDLGCRPARTLEQQIHRVDGGACPCSAIASSPGPLVPFDVDAGRIVAGGEVATVVYDAAGTQLLSLPVSPLAAQLAGSDLVVLVQGRLLVYDTDTGARLHAWPLPDVPSGGECGSPHYGTWECRDARLVLEDAARGLAAYLLDGQLHLLRLADGTDTLIGAASLARFIDTGLVYADDAHIRLLPFAQLPLR